MGEVLELVACATGWPKARTAMYTNQSATPGVEARGPQGCTHRPGMSTAQTCAWVRALARLAEWVEHAQQAHANCECGHELMGQLWVLYGELAFALDHCPNAAALPSEVVKDGVAAHTGAAHG